MFDSASNSSIEEESDSDAPADSFPDEAQDNFITIAKLYAGSPFGEYALIHSKPRMATVRALCDCHLMYLSRDDYNKVIGVIEKR